MGRVVGLVLLLVLLLVAWRLLALVTGLIFHFFGLLVLVAIGYYVYHRFLRRRR